MYIRYLFKDYLYTLISSPEDINIVPGGYLFPTRRILISSGYDIYFLPRRY